MKTQHLAIIIGTIVCLVIIGNVGGYAQTDLTDRCASDTESKKASSINPARAISLANHSQTYAVNSIGYYVTFDHIWYDGVTGSCRVDVEFDFYKHGSSAWCITYMDFQEDLNLNNVTKLINEGGNCQQSNPNPNLIPSGSTIYDGIAHVVSSPLKQYKSGVLINNIRCKEDFRLVIDNNDFPACLKPEHAMTLIERVGSLASLLIFDCEELPIKLNV